MAMPAGPPTSGTYPINLSSSFLHALENDAAQDGLVAFKYKFKPSSITHASAGELHPAGSVSPDQVLAMQHANGEGQSAFKVKEDLAKKLEVALIWDEETETFTLHPLSSTLNLTLDRNLAPPAINHTNGSVDVAEDEPGVVASQASPVEAVDNDDELERQLQAQLEEGEAAEPEAVSMPDLEPEPEVEMEPVQFEEPVPAPIPEPAEDDFEEVVEPPPPRPSVSPIRPVSPVASLAASTSSIKRPQTPEVSVFQPKKKKRPSAVNTAPSGTRASAREMAAKAWSKTAVQAQPDADVAPEPEADADEDDLDDFAAMMEQSLANPTPAKPASRGKGTRGTRGARGGRGRGGKAKAAAAPPPRADSPDFVEVAVPEPVQPATSKSLTAMMGLPDDEDDSSDESSDDD